MMNFINNIRRFINGLKRSSKKTNMRKLHEREETIDSFTFRDAKENDIPDLGKLHALAWAQTYGASNPNFELRQYQWTKAFTEENNGSWF